MAQRTIYLTHPQKSGTTAEKETKWLQEPEGREDKGDILAFRHDKAFAPMNS